MRVIWAVPVIASILILGIILMTAVPASAQSCTPPPSGMISWWPGDGNANDLIGDNDGQLIGDATFAAGLVGGAFSLDGFTDSINVPDSDSLDTGTSFTIDAWFNTDNVNKIEPGGTGQKTQTIVMYGFTDLFGKNNLLSIKFSKLEFSIRGIGPGFQELVGTTTITSNTWYHTALTYDGTTANLYLDGSLEDSELVTMNLDSNSRVLIGRYHSPSTNNLHFDFDGKIDEVEIFDRALSQSEIQISLMRAALGSARQQNGFGSLEQLDLMMVMVLPQIL